MEEEPWCSCPESEPDSLDRADLRGFPLREAVQACFPVQAHSKELRVAAAPVAAEVHPVHLRCAQPVRRAGVEVHQGPVLAEVHGDLPVR